jgi:hypothetical protein
MQEMKWPFQHCQFKYNTDALARQLIPRIRRSAGNRRLHAIRPTQKALLQTT